MTGWHRTQRWVDGKPVIEDHPPRELTNGLHVVHGQPWPVYSINGKLRCEAPDCPVCRDVAI